MTLLPAQLHVHGFSLRKRRLLRRFLPDRDLRAVADGTSVPRHGSLLLWGAAPVPVGTDPSVTVVRAEDGFLRSAGLGADLVRPLSWIFDAEGIYFDATRPSALESALATATWDEAALHRARRLRQAIVRDGVTKYGVGRRDWQPPAGRTPVLVIGQVEGDASLRLGSPAVRTNRDLLAAVRAGCPDAWLVYKPHPDVVAGLRAAGSTAAGGRLLCDEIVTDVSLPRLLAGVAAVHVMTSLAGFEALLRDVPVICHGLPFYAGWGLTEDRLASPRRTRRRTLDELVAAALLDYPRYVEARYGTPCGPETVLPALAEAQAALHDGVSWRQGLWRAALRRTVGVA